MIEGHLEDYPDWFGEEYQSVREAKLDFYYVVRNHRKDVFLLADEAVEIVNNHVEMTPKIVDVFQYIFKTRRKNIINKTILPYKKIEEEDNFTSNGLEEMKYGKYVDVHKI